LAELSNQTMAAAVSLNFTRATATITENEIQLGYLFGSHCKLFSSS